MKWIGQHIYDLVSRFRHDVYLEDITTSTETDILVVDSDGKITKRASSGFASGLVTVTDSTTSTAFPVVFHDESNGLLDDTGAFTYNPSTGTLVTPNLTVSGTTTTINTATLTVEDQNVVLNYNASSDTSGSADGAGITIQDAVDASNDAALTWLASSDLFNLSHGLIVNNTNASTGAIGSFVNAMLIDYNKSGVAGAVTQKHRGLYIDVDDSATNNAGGTVWMNGASIAVNSANAQGAIVNTGLEIDVAGADTNYGIDMEVEKGGGGTTFDMILRQGAHYCAHYVGSNGATTITTQDGSGHAADLTFTVDGFTKFTSPDTTGGGVEIENASASGAPALLIDNDDVDQFALRFQASNTTEDVMLIGAPSLTTGNAINIDCDSLTTGSAVLIDVDDALTTTAVKSLLSIDYDKAGVTASGQSSNTTGLDINMADAATNNASGGVTFTGSKVVLDAASNQGTIAQFGYVAVLTDSDVANTIGYYSSVEDGGTDFKAVSSADSTDYFTIATGAAGATTLTTVDTTVGATANLLLDIDGDITLQPNGKNVFLAYSGTTYWDLDIHNQQLKIMDQSDQADYFTLALSTNGATTLTTVDAGAAAAHFEVAADGNITLDAAGTTTIESAGLIKLDGEAGVEIENGAAAAALLIDNDTVDQIALDIDAANTTANVIDINAQTLTTGAAIGIDANSLVNGGDLIFADWDLVGEVNNAYQRGIFLDIDKSGDVADGEVNYIYGTDIRFNDNGTNVGGSTFYGNYVQITDANADGTNVRYGFRTDISGGDAAYSYGLYLNVLDGGIDYFSRSSAAGNDYFKMQTGAAGATTLTTNDASVGVTAHFEIAADGNITLDSAAATNIESVGLIKTTGAGVEIENGASSGAHALIIDNDDVDVFALRVEAANTTANIVNVDAAALTTANAIHVDADALVSGSAISLDIDDALTTNNTKSLISVDYDKAGVMGEEQFSAVTGLDINMTDAATNHALGTTDHTGVKVLIDAASNQGGIFQTGYKAILTDGDVASTIGYYSFVEDGGVDFKAVSSADTGDSFSIATTTNGATTLTTVDGGAAAAHFEIAADGNITLDPAGTIALEADSLIGGNLRIGGSGDTSNNWITIDAQDGTDTTGGGICFYETGTDTIGAPQYGAKIVYNEDDDEFAIGTMHNNTFMRQIYMRRGFDYVYFADAAFVEGTTPTLGFSDTSTTVADTDVLGIIYWFNADDGGTTARMQAVATENHASGANGGTKIEFKTTPNTTSAEVLALTIGQDQSLTVAGDLVVSGDSTIFESADEGEPIVTIKSTHTTANKSGELKFLKDAADTEDGEKLGKITFYGENESNAETIFAHMQVTIAESDAGAEGGSMGLAVATHDGEMQNGLQIVDGDAEDEVDVNIGNGTASLTTVAGKLACVSRTFTSSGSTDGDHNGDVVYFGGTTSMTIGKIYHYKDDGTWEIANADAVATSDGLLGVALGAASDTNGMLLRGIVVLDHDPGAIGDVLYVQSDNAGTPGNATATAPSASGDCVRIIGYQIEHASNGNIWFNPDNTFVEVA